MRRPKVSVLLPTFNRARYLVPAVSSVLGQTRPDLELIVIDDGSTDHTRALLADVRDPRLRVIHQDHHGLEAALNRGLSMASGELIARNDSDDLWLPHLLETLAPVLEADAAIGLAYARSEGMDEDGRPLPELRGFPLRYPGDPLRSLVQADYTSCIASLARRSCVLDIGGWDEAVSPSSDWDLSLRLAARYRVVFVDETVARFRRHRGNLTASRGANPSVRLQAREQILDKVYGASDLTPAVRAAQPAAYRNLYLGEGHQWLERGDYREAFGAYGKAFGVRQSKARVAGRLLWSLLLWFGVGRSARATRCLRALLGAARARSGGRSAWLR